MCFKPGAIVRRDCGVSEGCTYYQNVNNPNPHIDARYINICSDCGLTGIREQRIVTHEYGHALNFDHILDRNCVMNATIFTDVPCRPDEINSLQSTYSGHRER